MLRIFIAIAIMIGASSALVAQTTPSLPKDAESLRKSYQDARQRALQPLDAKYKTELEKLLAAHTKAGHLDDAVAIRTELDSLALSGSTTAAKSTTAPAEPDVKASSDLSWLVGKSLVDGGWAWHFQENQQVSKTASDKPAGSYRYTVEADGRIKVQADLFLIKTKNRVIHFKGPDDKKGSEVRITESK